MDEVLASMAADMPHEEKDNVQVVLILLGIVASPMVCSTNNKAANKPWRDLSRGRKDGIATCGGAVPTLQGQTEPGVLPRREMLI